MRHSPHMRRIKMMWTDFDFYLKPIHLQGRAHVVKIAKVDEATVYNKKKQRNENLDEQLLSTLKNLDRQESSLMINLLRKTSKLSDEDQFGTLLS